MYVLCFACGVTSASSALWLGEPQHHLPQPCTKVFECNASSASVFAIVRSFFRTSCRMCTRRKLQYNRAAWTTPVIVNSCVCASHDSRPPALPEGDNRLVLSSASYKAFISSNEHESRVALLVTQKNLRLVYLRIDSLCYHAIAPSELPRFNSTLNTVHQDGP